MFQHHYFPFFSAKNTALYHAMSGWYQRSSDSVHPTSWNGNGGGSGSPHMDFIQQKSSDFEVSNLKFEAQKRLNHQNWLPVRTITGWLDDRFRRTVGNRNSRVTIEFWYFVRSKDVAFILIICWPAVYILYFVTGIISFVNIDSKKKILINQ